MDLDHAHLLPLRVQGRHRLLHRVGARAHDHDHPLRVRRPGVLHRGVLPPRECGEALHLLLNDVDGGRVEAVHRLAPLEVDVRVLRAAAQDRAVRGETAGAVRVDEVRVDHGTHVVEGELLYLLNLVRGAEAVEEVQEREARAQGRRLGYQGEVHHLLHVVGTKHGPAGGAAGHDVGMVAEDGEGLRRYGARRDVEDRGGEFPRDLVHVGDHQQKPLARREGRGERTRLQRAVHRPRRPTLGLQLGHKGYRSPDVLLANRAFSVGDLPHHRGRGDRVDGDDFVGGVRHVGRRRVAVYGYHSSLHPVLLL